MMSQLGISICIVFFLFPPSIIVHPDRGNMKTVVHAAAGICALWIVGCHNRARLGEKMCASRVEPLEMNMHR